MDSTVISAFISAAVTLLVCIITNSMQHKKTEALVEYRLSELTKQVEKHNNLVERVYALEKRADVAEERIKVANNRISDLENDGK